MFTLLLHHILCENVSVDYQVHFVSVQHYNAVCDVHCDHYVFILYVYVAEWKHTIRLKLAVTVTGVGDVTNIHAIL